MAEAPGEIHFRTILLLHSQGRRKGDPKHKCCGKKIARPLKITIFLEKIMKNMGFYPQGAQIKRLSPLGLNPATFFFCFFDPKN